MSVVNGRRPTGNRWISAGFCRRRTIPEALLRLIRQRWSVENEWHWSRDTQLGEDAHRYANRIGAPVFAFLHTIVMNLLRRGDYCPIRQGPRELA